MDSDLFAAIDRYIEELFVPPDAALEAALRSADDAGLPAIHVSPSQGKLLYLLARLCNATNILEIGALAGYSAIWLGRALPPGGRLISLESEPGYAAVARTNLARAGLDDRVEVRVGPALATLPDLEKDGDSPFDLIFLDADKKSYPAYLEWALRLARPGGLILADNVVRAGAVLQTDGLDESAQGAREFNAALAAEPRVEAVVQQQIGAKGHDGLAIAMVRR